MTRRALADVENAHRLGREAGAERAKFGGDCPYPHANLVLREAWLRGFSVGRIEAGITRTAPSVDKG